MARNNAVFHIAREGKVTKEIREKFFDGYSFLDIRNWLEDHGFDRHMEISLVSVEIAVLTPSGLQMQIRRDDNNQLGFWGGVVEDDESPLQAAVRELKEETGLDSVTELDLEFAEVYAHHHTYANGDKAYFTTYRYVLRTDAVVNVVTDSESDGWVLVDHTILADQQNFAKRLLGEA